MSLVKVLAGVSRKPLLMVLDFLLQVRRNDEKTEKRDASSEWIFEYHYCLLWSIPGQALFGQAAQYATSVHRRLEVVTLARFFTNFSPR